MAIRRAGLIPEAAQAAVERGGLTALPSPRAHDLRFPRPKYAPCPAAVPWTHFDILLPRAPEIQVFYWLSGHELAVLPIADLIKIGFSKVCIWGNPTKIGKYNVVYGTKEKIIFIKISL